MRDSLQLSAADVLLGKVEAPRRGQVVVTADDLRRLGYPDESQESIQDVIRRLADVCGGGRGVRAIQPGYRRPKRSGRC